MMSSSTLTSTSDVEVVVIGAGNAGLTAAVRLAQSGVPTLLLEQHNIPGGCATSFRRGRFEFEVALHQLSGLGTESHPFQIRRSGHCGLCRVKIGSGAVVSGPEARVRRSDEWTGHTHACTAFPVTDVTDVTVQL